MIDLTGGRGLSMILGVGVTGAFLGIELLDLSGRLPRRSSIAMVFSIVPTQRTQYFGSIATSRVRVVLSQSKSA